MTLNGAIMQLVEMRENSMMPVAFKPYFDKVIETISECVEPSEIPQWISCRERLPETEDKVLCQTLTKKGTTNFVLGYHTDDLGWCCGMNSNVIAWMPLPEPYRGGVKDEHIY